MKTVWPSRPTARATAEAFDILPPVTKIRSGFFAEPPFSKVPPHSLCRIQEMMARSVRNGAKAQRHRIAVRDLPRALHVPGRPSVSKTFGRTCFCFFSGKFLAPSSLSPLSPAIVLRVGPGSFLLFSLDRPARQVHRGKCCGAVSLQPELRSCHRKHLGHDQAT